MVVPPTPSMIKDELRREARAARRGFVAGLETAARERLEQGLAERLAPLLAGVVASYAAMGAEIDPRLVEPLLSTTGLVFPRVIGDALTFHAAAYAGLIPGHRGFLEPRTDALQANPDIVLVPLVAADLQGNRIGQGGGHYDRTLAALRATRPVTVIGLAWEVQIVAAIPADPWDQPLDWLVTPQRLVDCRAAR